MRVTHIKLRIFRDKKEVTGKLKSIFGFPSSLNQDQNRTSPTIWSTCLQTFPNDDV